MDQKKNKRVAAFERAREILNQDSSIAVQERESLLKLIQILAEAAEADLPARQSRDATTPITREIISKHSLLMLVKQQADELNALKKLSLSLTSSLNLLTVLDAVVNEAMRLLKNARTAHIFLYDGNKLEFGAALNEEGVRNKLIASPRRNGLTYTVAETGETIVVEDINNHSMYKNAPKNPAWAGSIIGLPLKSNDKVVGVMNLSRSNIGGFTPAELRLLSLLADQAAVAISNARLHEMVSRQAMSDIVTGLPNRRALDERIEEEVALAQRADTQLAVLMMDLDGFKAVNDTYGHAVGDDVLRAVFNHLASSIRSVDFLARYGGDELTLLARHTDAETAKVVGAKFVELMNNFSYKLANGKSVQLGISGGIALFPFHARNSTSLLRAADAALYQAKKHARGAFIMAQVVTGQLNPVALQKKK